MRIIYAADDGTQFDNQCECEHYEFRQSLKDLDKIKIISEDNKTCSGYDMFEDDTYNYATIVEIGTQDALESFLKISDYCGWCEFEQIPKPGIWKYHGRKVKDCNWIKIG